LTIPLARPWFDSADESSVLETLRSGWVGPGPKVAAFEKQFAEYVGSSHAVTVSSCTAALHLAVLAAGFGPEDEVIVPAFTWISTPNSVEYAGARPVFCDIDPATFNIDISDAARRLTKKTRGIIPVHLFGLSADMNAVMDFAQKHDLFVIEDAACALGCYSGEQHVGMLITRKQSQDAVFRSLRDIGSDRQSLSPERAAQQLLPDFTALGFNYRMTDLQAALGITQMNKFPEILEQRLHCARLYNDLINDSGLAEWLRPPALPRKRENAFQAYVCRLTPPNDNEATLEDWYLRRNRLMQRLLEAGIATRPGTHAPHMLRYYSEKYGIRAKDYPKAWRADWLTLALPLYAGLTEEEQAFVCERLSAFWPETK
jgi:perosamine synthetase